MQSYEFRFIFELEMKRKEKYTNDQSRRGRGIKEKKSKTIGFRKNDVVNKGRQNVEDGENATKVGSV